MSHPHHPHGQHPDGHPVSHGHSGHPASHGHGDHPETIKENLFTHKDDTSGKPAIEYMKNMKNQLRLVFWETTVGCNLECVHAAD